MRKSRLEQETVITYNRQEPFAVLFSASVVEKRKWERRGYPVEPYGGGWRAKVPIRALSYRKLSSVGRKRAKVTA